MGDLPINRWHAMGSRKCSVGMLQARCWNGTSVVVNTERFLSPVRAYPCNWMVSFDVSSSWTRKKQSCEIDIEFLMRPPQKKRRQTIFLFATFC